MEKKLLEQTQQYKVKRKKKSKFKKVFNILACVVVFCVTYALILPAITMEKKSYCGYEEHQHSEECYEKELICGQEEGETVVAHVHSSQCYSFDQNQICQIEESEGHAHSDSCKETSQFLACELEESEEHAHSDVCYQVSENIVCGVEEAEGHAHSDNCYEVIETLTCELEEVEESTEGHAHSDSCYENTMTCEQEEHEHELICFSDKNADVENISDWEATLPKELTGVWADDVLEIAKSQLGYEESTKNYIVTEDGKTQGYTRYGDWYGDSYGHWCAMYVSFCLHYAGVDTDLLPLDANCQNWIETLSKEKYNSYYKTGTYEPVPGDLIFFDWDADERSEHIGFVVENIPATENETAKIKTIEGNASDIVQYRTYEANDPEIMGFGKLPENPELKEEAVEKIEKIEKQAIKAVIYTDISMSEEAKQDRTTITVEGYLPDGITAKAYPVQLEEDLIEGRRIILAYDITLYDAEGNIFDAETEGVTLTVTIEPDNWTYEDEKIESEDCTIYYIPEEGEPELMETESEKDAVTFQTEHFSTYALTVGGTMNAVYLNGTSGKDSNSGTQNSPVKTFTRAIELLAEGGTIHVSGTVTVNDKQEWDLEGQDVTVKRVSSFTGPLFVVANGGSLTLTNITVNGGSNAPSSSSIATNSTYANGSAKAPLVVVNSGANLIVGKGAVLEYNSNKPGSSNNKFVENGYVGLGGAIYCNGTLTMRGGLIQYCEAQCGGGVYVEKGTFYMSSGTIDHCYARDIVSYTNRVNNFHKNAGGGVYVGDNATMTLSGGTISNNQSSREGGGISLGWLNRSNNSGISSYITTFTMNGGTITGNYAVSTGGGLNIGAGRQAYINAGYITNNTADGKEYQDTSNWVSSGRFTNVFSGGGIYIDAAQWTTYPNKYSGVSGKAVINKVIITDNDASNNGGGIAACGTSVNFIYGDKTNGTAIYQNSANEIYVYDGQISLGDTVLGGGDYNWKKSGSVYDNSLTDSSSAIVTAKKLATVYITGNSGYLGGGIGCNGLIEIGGEKEESTYINIKKIWEDDGTMEHPEYIEVQILQDGKPYGEPIKIYRTYDENGNEVWPAFYKGGLPSGHKYTVEEIEVPGYMATVDKEGQDFVITNKPVGFQVEKKWVDESGKEVTTDLPEFIEVQLYQNGNPYGETVMLTKDKNWSHIWTDLPEKDTNGNPYSYTVKEVSVPDGFYSTGEGVIDEDGKCVLTNIKSPDTSISVEKQWADGVVGADSVTVQLLKNGENYGESIVLSNTNKWFHKWDNLPKLDKNGNEIIYTVKELPVSGYTGNVAIGEKTGKTTKWEAVEEFENGISYLLVTSQGALTASGNSVKGTDVTDILANGNLPSDNAVLWTAKAAGTSARLQNGSGTYLAYSNSKFATSSSGSTVNYSGNKLYVESGSGYRKTKYYLTNITGSASSTESQGLTVTLYKRVESSLDYGEIHYVVTNTKNKGAISVDFAKYSVGSEDNIILSGAKIELYKLDEGTNSKTLIESWISESATSATHGIHTLELTSGTYYLEESEVPEGHVGLAGPIIFTVNAEDGSITIVEYPGYSDVNVSVDSEGNADFPIYNKAVFELPETGGMGTTMFYILGTILAIGAAVLLVTKKRMSFK